MLEILVYKLDMIENWIMYIEEMFKIILVNEYGKIKGIELKLIDIEDRRFNIKIIGSKGIWK